MGSNRALIYKAKVCIESHTAVLLVLLLMSSNYFKLKNIGQLEFKTEKNCAITTKFNSGYLNR